MRSVLFGLLLCLSVLHVPVWGQQTQPGMAPPPAPKDPQAISILNQALAVAGGANAIGSIKDYTASGSVTFHFQTDDTGQVTLKGSGLGNFRLDANLRNGIRTHVLDEEQTHIKEEDGSIRSFPQYIPTPGKEPTPVPSSDAFPYQPPKLPGSIALPALALAAVTTDPSFSVSYMGLIAIDGHSLQDIRIQRQSPGLTDLMAMYHTSDFFVDPSTFQLVAVQDMVPKNVVHQYWYSDYRVVHGVLVPFSIREVMGGQETWIIELDQIGFNAGLQASDFSL
jgi:hypothetical protein